MVRRVRELDPRHTRAGVQVPAPEIQQLSGCLPVEHHERMAELAVRGGHGARAAVLADRVHRLDALRSRTLRHHADQQARELHGAAVAVRHVLHVDGLGVREGRKTHVVRVRPRHLDEPKRLQHTQCCIQLRARLAPQEVHVGVHEDLGDVHRLVHRSKHQLGQRIVAPLAPPGREQMHQTTCNGLDARARRRLRRRDPRHLDHGCRRQWALAHGA